MNAFPGSISANIDETCAENNSAPQMTRLARHWDLSKLSNFNGYFNEDNALSLTLDTLAYLYGWLSRCSNVSMHQKVNLRANVFLYYISSSNNKVMVLLLKYDNSFFFLRGLWIRYGDIIEDNLHTTPSIQRFSDRSFCSIHDFA